jgi:DNA-binding transcriptional ArsR family regulator
MENSKKFVLVDINDDKSKQLATNLSNETSRKILDYLGGINEASETSIAEKLNLSLSTVHYNLQHLRQAGLVEVKQFSWSKKGKKIEYYRIAEKLIIIAPKSSDKVSILKKLSELTPVILFSLAGSALVYMLTRPVMNIQREVFTGSKMAEESLSISAVPQASSLLTFSQAHWFLFGALSAIILFALIIILRRNKK